MTTLTKKPASAKGGAAAKKPKALAVKDLQTATAASVRAVLGKGFPPKPGVLAGFWLPDKEIDRLDRKPEQVAAEIAKGVSQLSGVRVRPQAVRAGGGILVGYIQPRVMPNR